MTSREAVIVSGARTAIGTAHKGSLVDVDALELGTKAVAEAVRQSGIAPELVDDVIMGESLYGGGDIARYAAIEAGLVNAPGVAHNRYCASGLAAVQSAAASIIAGMDRAVVAGGRAARPAPPPAKPAPPDDVGFDLPRGHPAGLDRRRARGGRRGPVLRGLGGAGAAGGRRGGGIGRRAARRDRPGAGGGHRQGARPGRPVGRGRRPLG